VENLGQQLRTAREAKGLSLAQVEAEIRVRERILAALESGEYAALPAPVYSRGFVRAYARFLELDPETAVAAFDRDQGATVEPPPAVTPAVTPVRLPSRLPSTLLLVVAGGVTLVLLFNLLLPQIGNFPLALPSPSPSPTATATLTVLPSPTPTVTPLAALTPTPQPSPTPCPTPFSGVEIQVRVTDRVWLRVEVDRQLAFEGLLEAGDTRVWSGRDEVRIRSGKAGETLITYNGRYQGAMGDPGAVVEKIWGRP